jgi:hypothetical protein
MRGWDDPRGRPTVPLPCQNGPEWTVISGHSRRLPTTLYLGHVRSRRLTIKPDKEEVRGLTRPRCTDETPVNLLDPHAGLAAEDAGAPHVLVVRTPHRGLTWLRALGSRQAAVCYPSRRAGASLAASGRPGRDRGPCGRDGGRRHETSKSAPPSGDSPIRQ